jgi:hypothetical protein
VAFAFNCQQNVNEKRRTQRKSKSDSLESKQSKQNGDVNHLLSDTFVVNVPMDVIVKNSYENLSFEKSISDIKNLMQYAVSDTDSFDIP